MNIKKMGFTLVELLAVIVVLAILGGLAVISINNILDSSKKSVYKNYENTMESAGRNYFIDNIDKIPKVGESNAKKIYLSTLIAENYIDDFKDPNGGICSTNSYIIVSRRDDNNNNFDLSYKSCLICILNGKDTYNSCK